ncbi:hypothetical protein [Actinomadura rudentiformis]|uniref:RHS repeat protein n=1 Tax=Actinomadura rudentiformis TaxID=359158 RepID=A0A6H9Z067_9ACTN|nr:hypothetical protein [Actinomadura rudentiformis]KAB2347836.1 hypothetical protein F8566_18255 [Actinomadura rudentiformis]
MGSGPVLTQQWDAAHRMIAQSLWGVPAPTTGQAPLLQHRTYQYRPDGNVTAIGDRRFALDRAEHVTAVQARDWAERYAYDTTGNITEADWPVAREGDDAGLLGAANTHGERW